MRMLFVENEQGLNAFNPLTLDNISLHKKYDETSKDRVYVCNKSLMVTKEFESYDEAKAYFDELIMRLGSV